MKTQFQPWQFLLLILAGWINRRQQDAVEYLITENRILRQKLGKKRILLGDDQRRQLAAIAIRDRCAKKPDPGPQFGRKMPVWPGPNLESLESQARYIARPAMAMEALQQRPDGTLAMETGPDPRSGATLLVLDALEWIHRIVAHIPDPGQHTRRSYGAYCNRARVTAPAAQGKSDRAAQARSAGEDSEFARETRRTWSRLIRKIFEVDPLLCSCGAGMKIVSIITQPRIVDRILRHLGSDHCQARDPFEPRAPPRAAAFSLQ